MRKTDDKRHDYEIKEEIYNENFKDNYNIVAAFDDRLNVCRTLYKIGIPLFRVGDPDANF